MILPITKNFDILEFFTVSEIHENKISVENIINITYLCMEVLQPLRDAMGEVILITSGYRSESYNLKIGGRYNSQHLKAQAADFKCNRIRASFDWIKDNLIFDQLIWEGGDDHAPAWIHVSYNRIKNRNMVLYLR